ncbi:MAG: tetratricopeptide repeat protein [Pseudolabrys sp.]
MTSSSLARCIVGTALTVLLAAAPVKLFAQPRPGDDMSGITAAGSYLAARHANQMRDAVKAAQYYRDALKRDPKNPDLLNRAFLSLVIGGEIKSSVPFAERVLRVDKNDRIGLLVLGVHALKEKRYRAARRDLMKSVHGPITDLTATLLAAWSMAGEHQSRNAVKLIDRLSGPDWYAIFKDLNAGMILDLGGHQKEAGVRLAQAYKLDSSALRVVEAYGSWLSRNGKPDEARQVFAQFNEKVPNHPLVLAAMKKLGPAPAKTPAKTSAKTSDKTSDKTPTPAKPHALDLPAGKVLGTGSRGALVKDLQNRLGVEADGIYGAGTRRAVEAFQRKQKVPVDGIVGSETAGKLTAGPGAAVAEKGAKLPRVVGSAQAGAAEALYGLGASLGRRGGEDLGLVYLQLALYLQPHHSLALISIADLYDSIKKPELALAAYERIPAGSPLARNAAIQMASDLDALGRTEEAKAKLQAVLKASPDDLEALMALGNLMRAHKEFAKCGPVYTKAIATVKDLQKPNWVMFYFRGICYERSHQWPKAEADFKQALKLFPDQPHVLNYLGYSWIDKGVHLDEGMAMIKKAVKQRPDDGYIVDSLGWAYYKLGNYAEAVKHLQHAIELKPADPTINDHYGDALWRVGRKLDARYQWMHARDMKPDPDELAKIEDKLKNGLSVEQSSQATATKRKLGDGG